MTIQPRAAHAQDASDGREVAVRLPQWDAAIERKLKVLDGIYEKLSSRAASRRFEVLEVVIIVLIAVSSLTPFLPLVAE